MIHFIRPWFLLLLIPLAFLIWKLWHHARHTNPWQKICDPQLLPHLLQTRAKTTTHLPLILFAIGCLFTVLALSGPSWSQIVQPVYQSTAGNVIVLDMSPSMLTSDVKPNRFTRAKYKVLDLLSSIQDGATGLVVFSGEAYSVAPITNDSNTLSNLAMTLDPSIMPVSGNNLNQGLQVATKLLHQANVKPAAITVITDTTPDASALQTAQKLHAQGIKINVLGIGTNTGAPLPLPNGGFATDAQGNLTLNKLDSSSLQQLAAAGGGDYVSFTENDSDIKQLIQDLPSDHASGKKATEARVTRWKDEGQWFILLAVLCAVLAFRRGWWEEI